MRIWRYLNLGFEFNEHKELHDRAMAESAMAASAAAAQAAVTTQADGT